VTNVPTPQNEESTDRTTGRTRSRLYYETADACEDILDRVRQGRDAFTAPEVIIEARLNYLSLGLDLDFYLTTGHRSELPEGQVADRFMQEMEPYLFQQMEWMGRTPSQPQTVEFAKNAYRYFAALKEKRQLEQQKEATDVS
jgi:hypothetical protein